MNYYKILVLFLVICTGYSLQAQNGASAQNKAKSVINDLLNNPLSLDQAISKGLKNSYRLEINDRNIKIAQNNDTWGRAGKYPTVSAGLALNNNLTQETNQASFLRGEFLNASLTPSVNLNWNLYNGGLVGYQKQIFEQTVNVQKVSQNLEIQNTVRVIQQAYFTVLLEENRLNVLRDVFKLSSDRLNYQLIRKEYGQGNSFSIIQFEDAILADSTNVILQYNAIKNARQQLLRSMNEEVATDLYALTDQLSTTLEPLDKEDIRNQLLQNNPSIKLLELNRQIASINQRIAKTTAKPSVSLSTGVTAAYSLFQIFGTNPQTGDDYPLLDGQTYRWTTGVNASYPLYNGGVIKANIENARVQEEIAQFDVLESTADLMTQLDLLFNNYETQLQLVGILDERLKTAQRNIIMADERLKTGAISSLDYRNIQLSYLNISFSRISAIYNLLSIKTDIAFLVAQ